MSEPIVPAATPSSLMPSPAQRKKQRRLRRLKDNLSRYGVMSAGLAAVFSLGLIFFYLFSEIAPLFRGATLTALHHYSPADLQQTAEDPTEHLLIERYEEIGASFKRSGAVHFFTLDQGREVLREQIPRAADATFSSMTTSTPDTGLVAYGYSDGTVSVVRADYTLSYPGDQRHITPRLQFPVGEQPLVVDDQRRALVQLAVQQTASGVVVAAVTDDDRLRLMNIHRQENRITGDIRFNTHISDLPALPSGAHPVALQVDESARHLVIATNQAQLLLYDIQNPDSIILRPPVAVNKGEIRALRFLIGTGSLIVGTDQGALSQWFLVRDADNRYGLQWVREFNAMPGGITAITPEQARRGFWVGDDQGNLGIFYATSQRRLLQTSVSDHAVQQIAVSPIHNRSLVMDATQGIQVSSVWNKHPDVSFSSLWQKVWYEGRDAPEYIWQASSGSDNFEAKMSFVPLSVGTLKAAFFAMLFAIPLGVMGAIYTAYFMTPKLRGLVKPTIEIMEALPTVILGFLAGLWLAPFIEDHLPAVFSILLFLPLSMLATGYLWSRCPQAFRSRVPEGWEAVILVVPIILTLALCIAMSPLAELWFLDGSMRQWFTEQGIDYSQRNALVVGIVMGFAVVPTIFSIAEDAVFSVPRHLTQGSLALGATRWQTLVGVVLPTASPGIFSATMMGFGRAVGETMIVLMATGNSPLVNFNLFEGMRTFSANIAVELPETAVASTHFRVLFLAALVLLALTFVMNTLAEVIRQRLRKRYSNL